MKPSPSQQPTPALTTFDRELTQHDNDGNDSWYDSGVLFVGQLAADLTSGDLIALEALWPTRSLPWQTHCAEALGQAGRPESIVALLGMVERAHSAAALAALGSLADFKPSLFTAEQRQRTVTLLEATQARPVGRLHHLVLGDFLARLRSRNQDGD